MTNCENQNGVEELHFLTTAPCLYNTKGNGSDLMSLNFTLAAVRYLKQVNVRLRFKVHVIR